MLCSKCYRDMSPLDGKCPLCGEALPGDSGTGETIPVAGAARAGRTGCPWEERERIGTFAAFGETLQRSLFHPSAFFRFLDNHLVKSRFAESSWFRAAANSPSAIGVKVDFAAFTFSIAPDKSTDGSAARPAVATHARSNPFRKSAPTVANRDRMTMLPPKG